MSYGLIMFTGIFELIQKTWENTFQVSMRTWQNPTIVDLHVVGYWTIVFVLLLLACLWFLSNRKLMRIFESVSNNLLVVSFIIWLSGVVVYLFGFYNEELHWLSVIPRAIISSFKMFVVAHDLARVNSNLQADTLYMIAFSIVHFVAAFITFLFIFKLVGYKIKSTWSILWHKWWHAKGRVVHLFWGVNEASLLLAEDIRKQHEKDTIIFVDIDEECDDSSQKKTTLTHIAGTITIKNREITRLEDIEAFVDHCYNGPACLNSVEKTDFFGMLHLNNIRSIVQKSSCSYFYFLSDDEVNNISGALNLQQDQYLSSMGDNKPVIYVHARKNANNEVFDHYSQYDGESQRMKIKIVDSAYLSVAKLKQDERALPVHCVNFDKTTGLVDSSFTALIVGFGGTGQEAFKFLYEFSAFIGSNGKKSPFKCYAIDEKMNKMSGLIREKMPAIGEEELSLIQTSVDSEDFWKQIKNIINELNYVVIALDNDTLGLSLAVNLFKYSLQSRDSSLPKLKIMIRCYDGSREKRMKEVVDKLNKSVVGYNIEIGLFGEQKDLYTCDMILSDVIIRDAKEFHRIYEKSTLSTDEQWKKDFDNNVIDRMMDKGDMFRYHAIYDVNRRIAQNISNVLHCRTKMRLMGFKDKEVSERLKLYYEYVNTRKDGTIGYQCSASDERLLHNIAIVEHERWIASHKLMGYTYNPENDCVKKYHRCLCSWEKLDEETKSYDCNVVDTTIKMAYKEVVGGE